MPIENYIKKSLLKKLFLPIIIIAIIILFIYFNQNEIQYISAKIIANFYQLQIKWQQIINSKIIMLKKQHDIQIELTLIAFSFGYGLLHALGPGHGKAIMAAFVISKHENYKTTAILSVISSLLQGLSAIMWVAITFAILKWLMRDSIVQIKTLYPISYIITILLGIILLIRAIAIIKHNNKQHNCNCCNCKEVATGNLTARILAMLAIGIRPCSGAIIVLAVTWQWDIISVGIIMVMSMSLGTALTVTTIALLVVYGRINIVNSLYKNNAQHFNKLSQLFTIISAIVLILIGTIMLLGILLGENISGNPLL